MNNLVVTPSLPLYKIPNGDSISCEKKSIVVDQLHFANDFPKDQFLSKLCEYKILNHDLTLNEKFAHLKLPPIGKEILIKIVNLLTKPIAIKTNDNTFFLTLIDLLKYLKTGKSINNQIENIEIVGGMVFWLLKDYLKTVFSELGIENFEDLLTPEILQGWDVSPSDIDLRLFVTGLNNGNDLRDFNSYVVSFLAEKLPPTKNIYDTRKLKINQQAFSKYKHVFNHDNCFSTVAFNDDFGGPAVDILFVKNLKRLSLFVQDALRLNVDLLIKGYLKYDGSLKDFINAIENEEFTCEIIPESDVGNGLLTLIYRIAGIVNAEEPETINEAGWSLLMSAYTKGKRGLDPHLKTKLLKTFFKTNQGRVIAAAKYWLEKTCKTHHQNNPLAAFALTFNGCVSFPSKELVAHLWKEMRPTFEKTENTLVQNIDKMISAGIPFEEILAQLQAKAFFHMCTSYQGEDFQACIVQHNKSPALRIGIEGNYLLLPFNPINAFSIIKESQSLGEDEWIFPKISYHSEGSVIGRNLDLLKIDWESLKNIAQELFKKNTRIGSELLGACAVQTCNKDIFYSLIDFVPHLPNYLLQSFLALPLHEELLKGLKEIDASSKKELDWALALAKTRDEVLVLKGYQIWKQQETNEEFDLLFLKELAKVKPNLAVKVLIKLQNALDEVLFNAWKSICRACQKRPHIYREIDLPYLLKGLECIKSRLIDSADPKILDSLLWLYSETPTPLNDWIKIFEKIFSLYDPGIILKAWDLLNNKLKYHDEFKNSLYDYASCYIKALECLNHVSKINLFESLHHFDSFLALCEDEALHELKFNALKLVLIGLAKHILSLDHNCIQAGELLLNCRIKVDAFLKKMDPTKVAIIDYHIAEAFIQEDQNLLLNSLSIITETLPHIESSSHLHRVEKILRKIFLQIEKMKIVDETISNKIHHFFEAIKNNKRKDIFGEVILVIMINYFSKQIKKDLIEFVLSLLQNKNINKDKIPVNLFPIFLGKLIFDLNIDDFSIIVKILSNQMLFNFIPFDTFKVMWGSLIERLYNYISMASLKEDFDVARYKRKFNTLFDSFIITFKGLNITEKELEECVEICFQILLFIFFADRESFDERFEILLNSLTQRLDEGKRKKIVKNKKYFNSDSEKKNIDLYKMKFVFCLLNRFFCSPQEAFNSIHYAYEQIDSILNSTDLNRDYLINLLNTFVYLPFPRHSFPLTCGHHLLVEKLVNKGIQTKHLLKYPEEIILYAWYARINVKAQFKISKERSLKLFENLIMHLMEINKPFSLKKAFLLMTVQKPIFLDNNPDLFEKCMKLIIHQASQYKHAYNNGTTMLDETAEEILGDYAHKEVVNPLTVLNKDEKWEKVSASICTMIFDSICNYTEKNKVLDGVKILISTEEIFNKAYNFLVQAFLKNCFKGNYQNFLLLIKKLIDISFRVINNADSFELMSKKIIILLLLENKNYKFGAEDLNAQNIMVQEWLSLLLESKEPIASKILLNIKDRINSVIEMKKQKQKSKKGE